MTHNPHCNVYIADCSAGGGIYVFDFFNGQLTQRQKISLDRPMYLYREKNRLYCILRAPFSDSPFSGVLSMEITADGLLKSPGEIRSTDGVVSCHLCVRQGKVYTANYLSGSVALLGEKTVQHTGSGVHLPRQEAPHVHYVGLTPDNAYLFVCDLGLDTVFVYDLNLNLVSSAQVPAGHGVRHLVGSTDGKTVYSINELASTISVFEYQKGSLQYLTTVSAVDNAQDLSNIAAAIKLSGNFLYTSQRGNDEITVLDISQKLPSFITRFSSGGHSPRDFAVIGEYIIVTNEGGTVAVLNQADGRLMQTIPLDSPLCIIQ